MATSAVVIDPTTGERVQSAPVQIDPKTGERIAAHEPGFLEPHPTDNAAQAFLRGAASGVANIFNPDTYKQQFEDLKSVLPVYTRQGFPMPNPDVVSGGVARAQAVAQNPAYTAGSVVGPAVVSEGAAKVAPMVARGAVDVTGRATLLGKTPEGAYESALKPSTTISQTRRANIVQTGLENAIPVSKAGMEKIGDLVDDLNQRIAGQIASDPNRPISPSAAAQKLNDARARFGNQVTPAADLNAINNVGKEFMGRFTDPQTGQVQDIPASQAQAMKQGTYQVLKGKYGEQGSATVEAQKALARGLKDEIAAQFPEISTLNAQESKLLDLQPVLERAVNRISNHQLVGIGTPVAGAAAKAVTGSSGLGGAVAVLKAVLDNPNVKSRLAIAVSKAQKIPFGQASARVQAYSTALGSYLGSSGSNAQAAAAQNGSANGDTDQ